MTAVYSQHDIRWGGMMLGHGPGTISQFGCLLCCHAQVSTELGAFVTPDILDTLYIAENIYVNGNQLKDDALAGHQHITGGIPLFVLAIQPWAGDVQSFHSGALERGIIGIKLADHSHFMTIFSWDGHALLVEDPDKGAVVDFDANYNRADIIKVVHYGRPAPTIPTQPPVVDKLAQAKTLAQQIVNL